MNLKRTKLTVALFAVGTLALAGCGGDPLVGTWKSTSTNNDGSTSDITITFNADGSYTSRSATTYPSNASFRAGCMEVTDQTGGHYAEGTEGSAMSITVSGTRTSTYTVSGCADATNNQASTTSTDSSTQVNTYMINGNLLTLSQSSGGLTISIILTKQ